MPGSVLDNGTSSLQQRVPALQQRLVTLRIYGCCMYTVNTKLLGMSLFYREKNSRHLCSRYHHLLMLGNGDVYASLELVLLLRSQTETDLDHHSMKQMTVSVALNRSLVLALVAMVILPMSRQDLQTRTHVIGCFYV